MAKLTKTQIDNLKPGDGDYFVWCDALPGFGVRVWPSGRKTYVAQYRAGARTRRVKIGNHGALTVEEARREAKAILGDVARGEDPQADKLTRRKAITVRELCADYLAAAERGLISGKGGRPKKATTLATDSGRIDRHIVPLLGSRLVIELTAADVAKFIRDVQAGRTAADVKTKLRGRAIVEGGPGTAARTAGLLGGILSFAVESGIIDRNPAQGVKRPAGTPRTRRLTPEEYRQLGKALAEAEAEAESALGIAGIWLLALTGCRLGEVEALKWAEVDFDSQCLRLGDTKTGRSVRPLGRAAIDVLERIDRIPGREYVLPAVRGSGHFGGMPGVIKRVMARAGLAGVTAHTLRHGFASMAGDIGFNEGTIGAMIGHAAGSVTSRYVHRLDAVLVAAADKTARAVHGAITGAEAKVVKLPSAKRLR
jgi:integrase